MDVRKRLSNLIAADDNYIVFLNGKIFESNLGLAATSVDIIDNNRIKSFDLSSHNANYININNDGKIKVFHILNVEGSFESIIVVNDDTTTEIYEYFINKTSGTFNTKVQASKNSSVKFFSTKIAGCDSHFNYSFTSHIEQGAVVDYRCLNSYCGTVAEKITGVLLNKDSLFNVYSVNINDSKAEHNLEFIAHHEAGNSNSNFSCFGFAKNNSTTVIDTLGIIDEKASKANINHNIKGIILDDLSVIHANPILEIDEYDVVAGHGASVGDIDEDQLYYLMSRGLTLEDSQRLIISGLILPVLDSFTDELFSKNVIHIIDEKF